MSSDSLHLRGLGVSPGVALGAAFVIEQLPPKVSKRRLEEAASEAELERLQLALATSDAQLQRIRQQVEGFEGAEHLLILEAHRLMLQDPAFVAEAERLIQEENCNAEWAVRQAALALRRSFAGIEDAYFRERREDLGFVADRVIRNLLGGAAELQSGDLPAGCVLIARDLSPSEAMSLLIPGKVAALVTERGTKTSHTSIVAHSRDIPTVVGVEDLLGRIATGERVALDGGRGLVLLRPSEAEAAAFRAAREREQRFEAGLAEERSLPSRTVDGEAFCLRANIEDEDELPRVLEVGAQGVGLYRSEFLYLGRNRLPTEAEHEQTYRRVLERLGGQALTIRTMDLGADKLPPGLAASRAEANPALGLRALRLGLRHPEILQAQLRGILRASAHGKLRLLFPMISGVDELRLALAAWEEAQAILAAAGEAFDPEIPVGVMIELPAAVLVADRLAQLVDFFSIGTNDLIQYAMAIDRQSVGLAPLYHPLHLSVLRMVQATVAAGRAAGIPVSLCGEMASEPKHALLLLGLGLKELSMTAGAIPAVRRLLRRVRAEEARQLAAQALALDTAAEIEALVNEAMEALGPF